MKLIYEIFEEVENAPTRQEKIQALQRNDRWGLREVLRGTFDPRIEFEFKEPPAYKASDAPIGMGYSTIDNELKRAYIYEKHNPRKAANLTRERTEQLLIQTLESLEAKEAEIFANMLRKKSTIKSLTPAIVREAFPGLIG